MKHRLLFIFLVLLVSCVPHSKMVYLQDKSDQGDLVQVSQPQYLIRPGDILHIRVMTLDRESSDLFNLDESRMTSTATGSNMGLYIYGYSVNQAGNILLPVVGLVEVGQKTVEQAQQSIQQRIDEYLVGATVLVKLANFSVTVLGEVKNPGVYYVYDNDFTLLDLLGMAGDLTDFANRRVNLVRQEASGLKFHTVDLTSRHMVNSELFYLQSGDLVYVEPHKVKRLGFSQFPFALIFSTISTTLLLINFFSN